MSVNIGSTYIDLVKAVSEMADSDPDCPTLVGADQIKGIYLTGEKRTIVGAESDVGIIWEGDGTLFKDENAITEITNTHFMTRVPIVAGNNVTFETDTENQVVKINATGGSGTGESSIIDLGKQSNHKDAQQAMVDYVSSHSATHDCYLFKYWCGCYGNACFAVVRKNDDDNEIYGHGTVYDSQASYRKFEFRNGEFIVDGCWLNIASFDKEFEGLPTEDKSVLGAINELYQKIGSSSGGGSPMTPITYAELKALRDSGKLVAGMFYRITDYVCTTVQAETRAMSNRFDIIVQALSNNTLSETAKADYNAEDNYFKIESGGNALVEGSVTPYYYEYIDYEGSGEESLIEYKTQDGFIAYDYLENNEGQVVPVIYKTDIEAAKEDPEAYGEPDYYDIFYYIGTEVVDNVTYDKWRKIYDEVDSDLTWDSTGKIYLYTNVIVENNEIVSSVKASGIKYNANLPAWELKYSLDNDTTRFAWADETNGKGAIYYMKDEHGNECPYDFKNIQFKRSTEWQEQHTPFIEDSLFLSVGDVEWFYTFSWVNEDLSVDDLTMRQDLTDDEGLVAGTECNIIGDYVRSGIRLLNNNLMISSYQHDPGLFYGCRWNTFGTNCHLNTFGNVCNFNTFGNYCVSNTFGNDCSNNTFGNDCIINTVGNAFNSNTVGNVFNSNTFGNDCSNNTFGDACNFNTFGNYCTMNVLHGQNSSIRVGAWGGSCQMSEFESVVSDITLKGHIIGAYFEKCGGVTISGDATNIRVCQGMVDVTIEGSDLTTYKPQGRAVVEVAV